MTIEPEHDPNRPMSGGGWISGSSYTPPQSDIVAAAVLALSAFGGDLSQDMAEKLIMMWKRRHELSADDLVAVLDVFDA